MNRTILYIVIAAAAAIVPASAQDAWSKSSWGMTEQQLRDAFPGQLIEREMKFLNPAQLSRLAIDQVEIAGDQWQVHFVLNDSGNLESVRLMPIDGRLIDLAMFTRVEAALTEKYGVPFARSAEGTSTAQWKTAKTMIQLRYYAPTNIPLRTLHLTYARKTAQGNL